MQDHYWIGTSRIVQKIRAAEVQFDPQGVPYVYFYGGGTQTVYANQIDAIRAFMAASRQEETELESQLEKVRSARERYTAVMRRLLELEGEKHEGT